MLPFIERAWITQVLPVTKPMLEHAEAAERAAEAKAVERAVAEARAAKRAAAEAEILRLTRSEAGQYQASKYSPRIALTKIL